MYTKCIKKDNNDIDPCNFWKIQDYTINFKLTTKSTLKTIDTMKCKLSGVIAAVQSSTIMYVSCTVACTSAARARVHELTSQCIIQLTIRVSVITSTTGGSRSSPHPQVGRATRMLHVTWFKRKLFSSLFRR